MLLLPPATIARMKIILFGFPPEVRIEDLLRREEIRAIVENRDLPEGNVLWSPDPRFPFGILYWSATPVLAIAGRNYYPVFRQSPIADHNIR